MKPIKPIKRISLLTATGEENLGDELIALCELQELHRRYPQVNIVLFSHNPSSTKRFLLSQGYNFKRTKILQYFPRFLRERPLLNCRLLWSFMTTIVRSDHIYIGGGGLFYTKKEEGHSPLLLWSMRVMCMKIFRKKITYLSLGISANKKELRPFAHALFAGTTITVRDTKSQDTLQKLGYSSQILPDPVLSYTCTNTPKNKKIGIALRCGYIDEDALKKVIRILLSKEYEIILLPQSLHPTDENAHDGYSLQGFLLPGVSTTQSIEQTLKEYQSCSCIIAMRLHGMILSIAHEIPFIGLSYSQKTDVLLQDLNWNYVYSTNDFDLLLIPNILEEIAKNRQNLTEKIHTYHTMKINEYRNTFPSAND